MNGKMAKRLRRMAKMEMSSNATTVDRELVLARVRNGDRVINEPLSVRAMYLKLKWALKESVRNPHSRVISSEI
jgi:hypothetical protein